MTQETIKAARRDAQGTGASRRLRREGYTPGIVYGGNREPLSISVEQNPLFYALQRENFHTSVLVLELDGETLNVLVRDFQMHPFKQQVQHIDFQIVDMEKPVRVKVPVHLKNGAASPAVKLSGGRISQLANSVELLVSPKAIPEKIELDLAGMVIEEIKHLSDLTLPEGAVSVAAKRGLNPAVAAASKK